MTQVLFGPRLGKEGKLRVGCSATIFDEKREKVLLTQRTDNGRWCSAWRRHGIRRERGRGV